MIDQLAEGRDVDQMPVHGLTGVPGKLYTLNDYTLYKPKNNPLALKNC